MPPPGSSNTDIPTQLAEIKGMLLATLPHHSARLDSVDRRIEEHDARIRSVETGQAAAVAAVAADRRLPNWVSVLGAISALALVVVTLVAVLAK